MAKSFSPLLGYNHNIRHKGKLYHVQTEDSGIHNPHIITHLFADGGRIIASKKTNYARHLGSPDAQQTIKRLMQEQHKGMIVALRDCAYDDIAEPVLPITDVSEPDDTSTHDLERAAAAKASEADGSRSGRYRAAVPASPVTATTSEAEPAPNIFGGGLMSEKSLDEVILSYLSDDVEEEER